MQILEQSLFWVTLDEFQNGGMEDVTASPSPWVTAGEDVESQFIVLPSVTPSLPPHPRSKPNTQD